MKNVAFKETLAQSALTFLSSLLLRVLTTILPTCAGHAEGLLLCSLQVLTADNLGSPGAEGVGTSSERGDDEDGGAIG